MKIDAFLTCLGYYGVSTGASTSLEGAYALTSGTTGVFYNQLYTTGAHFVNGQIYGPTLPLINVYPNNLINNNTLSGTNGLRVGYQHTGNFSIVMDIEYSGCTRPSVQKGMILLSTVSTPSGLSSGFIVGINDANRVYFNTSGYYQTLDKELTTRDFVSVSVAEQKFVSVGIFNLNDNALYKTNISLPTGLLTSNNIYLGNFLTSAPADPYTGFVGKINQVVLFFDTLTDSDIGICANCSLVTGFNKGVSGYNYTGYQLTGSYFSGVMDWAVTGTVNTTGIVVTHEGGTMNIIMPSGMTGYFQTGQIAIPLFSGMSLSSGRDTCAFSYDQNALNAFSTFRLYFKQPLTSGDMVEIYTYPQVNNNIGERLFSADWPSGQVQLIINGVNETANVDYYVSRNQLSGYSPDDIYLYDLINAPSIVTAYSGYWSNGGKVWTGAGWWPPASQYLENTAGWTGQVKITGMSGSCTGNVFWPRFGYDLHMNGQKLISGIHYNVITSGVSGFVVSLSGDKMPPLYIVTSYDGVTTGIVSYDDNELAFIPQFSGFQPNLLSISGLTLSVGPATGFGEQVWLNGLRQTLDVDYNKTFPCSEITGTFTPPPLLFTMYDSDGANNALWNIQLPPTVLVSGQLPQAAVVLQAIPIVNANGYPVTGNCLEVRCSKLIAQDTYGVFAYYGQFPSGLIEIPYAQIYDVVRYPGWVDTNNWGTGFIMVRYNYNNVIGPWGLSSPIAIQDNT